MKTITINTNGILNAVANASNFTTKEGEFSGQIVLSGNDGKLAVKATDMMQTLIFKDINYVSSDLTDTDFDTFSLEAKRLSTVLKAAKTDEVQIELNSENIIVKSGRSKVKIDTFAKHQEIDIVSKDASTFNFSEKLGCFEQILHAVDSNNPKFELNGVLLQAKGGVFNIVGTDTKRLSANTSDTDVDDFEVIVPRDGIKTMVKLFGGLDITANIDDTTLAVHTDTVSYSSKLINGKYPEWQRIVPAQIEQSFSINRQMLSEMIQEASILNNEIIISIGNEELLIQDFQCSTEVTETIETGNAQIKFGANARNMLDFLSSYNEDMVQIGFNGANMPIMLIASPEYKEIIMPIIISQESEVVEDAAA